MLASEILTAMKRKTRNARIAIVILTALLILTNAFYIMR